ncbi:hypothetical protein [Achromobacter xylosoxidans]|uniref:hypothetical protein n=1 Tax=Alcaligenes xylosoxydans xylosoxydans TaxID=85698 RepID=UPI00165DC9CD|nr:hypothetical protein [Achromobacter xylosoxidans]
MRADAVSVTTAALRHIALFLSIDCIPDFNKKKARPGSRNERSVRIDWVDLPRTRRLGFVALLHCRTRILRYPAPETKRHVEKTSFHLWDNGFTVEYDKIPP